MILALMIGILLIGGVLCWLAAQWSAAASKWIALLAAVTDLALSAGCWLRLRDPGPNAPWFIDFRKAWIPSFGISFHLALDGLSLVLLLLTFFLGTLAVLCSWREIKQRRGFFFFCLLWTLAGIAGVFVAMDLFLFYFFWEVMLVPMYFLIALWGDTRRRYAAYKFFIFTQAGGLLMLLSILALYFIHGQGTGNYTFDYFSLLNTALDPSASKWIVAGFFIAFAIKLPVVPLHNWLPDAHSEAPTAGSLLLAGLLLKTGAYGIIRFILPFFPADSAAIANWAIPLGVTGIVYGALLAYSQTDLKRLIAYTSVSHMGFVLLGIFSFREIAMQGTIMQILTHGISTGALFVMAGMLKERLHTRDLGIMGGLWTTLPSMGGAFMLFTMASLGLPMLGNFIAEFLILLGTFPVSPILTVLASGGLILSALYSLRMVQKTFLGPPSTPHALKDLSSREWLTLSALSISIIALGLFPQPVIDLVRPVVRLLVSN
jgi:NADH-quinone oxidoreductase subunit M